MTDKYVCVSFTKVSVCVFLSTVIWPLFTAKEEEDVVFCDYTPFTFLVIVSRMFWGKQDSRVLSFGEILCVGMCRTFFIPIDATFASGLICIPVHLAVCCCCCWLVFIGLTQRGHFKNLTPLLYCLLLFSLCILPLLLFLFLVHFPPSVLFRLDLFCILPILSLFLFCPFCLPHLCASFWCLLNTAIEVQEFG